MWRQLPDMNQDWRQDKILLHLLRQPAGPDPQKLPGLLGSDLQMSDSPRWTTSHRQTCPASQIIISVRLTSLSPVQRLSRWDRSLKPWSPADRCETPDSLAPCQRSTLRRLCQNRRMLRTEAVRGWDSQPRALLAQSLSATVGGLLLRLLLRQPGGWEHSGILREKLILFHGENSQCPGLWKFFFSFLTVLSFAPVSISYLAILSALTTSSFGLSLKWNSCWEVRPSQMSYLKERSNNIRYFYSMLITVFENSSPRMLVANSVESHCLTVWLADWPEEAPQSWWGTAGGGGGQILLLWYFSLSLSIHNIDGDWRVTHTKK